MSERIIDKLWTLSMDEIEAERKWIERQVVEMGDGNIKSLAMTAATERKKAITPLSGYHVGAALLGESKRVFSRSNMEVRVRPLGAGYAYHAEGSSIWKAVVDGEVQQSGRRFIRAIAVSHEGASGENWSGPCGICLQDMYEFCDNALVVLADEKGNITHITSLKTLMPKPFTPSHLGI